MLGRRAGPPGRAAPTVDAVRQPSMSMIALTFPAPFFSHLAIVPRLIGAAFDFITHQIGKNDAGC